MSVKRRDIVIGAAALATGASVVGALRPDKKAAPQNRNTDIASPNISKNRRQLRLATSWPKDFPGLGQMPNYISERVREMTDGRLDIKVYAAGELVGALECFDAVSTGAADMYHAAEYYWQGKANGFTFFTAVPNGMTAAEIMGWIDHGGGQELWDDLSAGFNIKPIQAGNTGHQMGGWYKREMQSLEDFRGLRMRIPGLGGEVIRRLGGTAVALPGGEIFQALQSGAIDATEWVGPWNDVSFGFHREAKNYYAPGFHEPGASLCLGVNLDVWNSFSRADQAVIENACQAVNHYSLGEYTTKNGSWLKVLAKDYNIIPKIFPDEITREVGRIADDVVAEFGNKDKTTQKIFESYLSARDTSRKWTEISDGLHIRARQIALDK